MMSSAEHGMLHRRYKKSDRKATFYIRATGIEPVSHAWEARVLPLNDARDGDECGRMLRLRGVSVK